MVDELFTLNLDTSMSAERLGEIERALERALCIVSAARGALLELEAAQNGHVRVEAGG